MSREQLIILAMGIGFFSFIGTIAVCFVFGWVD